MAFVNGAWVNGVFYDGIPLTAADLNANNAFLIAQLGPTVIIQTANSWSALQTFTVGLVVSPTTIAALPGTPVLGQAGYVTDAMSLTFGSAVIGGGSVKGPVHFNGTSWIAG